MKQLDGARVSSVSVVIMSYNRPEYLREALLSVLAQTKRPLEIAIFDNGSKQDVRDNVSDLLNDIVKWMGWEPHTSAENFQRAFAYGNGDYVYIMHDDDRLLPDFLSEMCGYLDAHQDLTGVACNAFVIDVKGLRREKVLLPWNRGDVIFKNRADLATRYADSYIPFPTVVYRRGPLSKLTTHEEYGQVGDVVVLLTLAAQGPLAFLDRPLMEYRVHSQQDSTAFSDEIFRIKEDYVIKCVVGSPQERGVKTLVSRKRAIRAAERLQRQLLITKELTKFVGSVPIEAKKNSRFWLLIYLMNPYHLSLVLLKRSRKG